MRKSEKLLNYSIKSYKNNKLIRAKISYILLRIIFACDIYYTAKIDNSIGLIHNGLGCVVHPKTIIGKNCRIYQNVTLGGNGKIKEGVEINKGGPILEDNVTIFSGACILGPVKIGTNSIVGANSVVLTDVPPNSIAVGIPAKIKPKKNEYNHGI